MFVTDVGKRVKKRTEKKAPGTMHFRANFFRFFVFVKLQKPIWANSLHENHAKLFLCSQISQLLNGKYLHNVGKSKM